MPEKSFESKDSVESNLNRVGARLKKIFDLHRAEVRTVSRGISDPMQCAHYFYTTQPKKEN